MNNSPRLTVVIVEDDEAISSFLMHNLELDGYQPYVATSLAEGLRLIEHRYPDVALVDVGLPDGKGFDLVEAVRNADGIATRLDPSLPIMMISGRGGELDRLRGFERGCDDYLVKPFSYPELRARLAALVRRSQGSKTLGKCRIGSIALDPASREVAVNGHSIALSQKEFALLRALASDPTKVFSKGELLRSVWGYRTLGATRTLDSHACRLRRKLEENGDGDHFVINIWGVGYRLVDGIGDSNEARDELLECV